MIVSFLVFVFALFLVLGAYLLATHGSDKKRAKLQKRLNGRCFIRLTPRISTWCSLATG